MTGPRFSPLAALLALVAMLPQRPALAQTPADPTVQPAPVAAAASAFADTTKPVTFLKEMVVTGSRYPRAYYESPQALSFLTRLQLREETPSVLGDALGTLPGVDLSKDSPWEQRPVLRGLGGQRVLVMMDGSPVNSARGNGPHPSLVDPAQVERIEVVRGPSSVAYGSDALGGAINIITREALRSDGDSFRGSATLGGSSVDRQKNAYLELMPQIGKLSAFLSSGGRRALDFSTPHDGRVDHSGFQDYNALFNLRYTLTEHYAIKGGYQLYRGSDIGLPGLKTDLPGFLQEFRFPNYDRDAAHLSVERDDPSSWFSRSQAKLYYQKEHRNFYSHEEAQPPYTGPPPAAGATTQISNQDRFFDLKSWGFQTQFTSRKSSRYLLTAGVDLARDQTDGDNVRHRYWVDGYGTTVFTNADRITASVPDGTFDSYATFAQSEWYLAPRWTANAGGRFTHYRQRTKYGLSVPAGQGPAVYFQPLSVDDGAFSGSLGLVYSPLKDLRVTANVANGFREPNAQDRFFNGPASVGTVLGNPTLEPEKSISYDLGLRWGPGDFAVAGNLFYSTYTNLIDALDVTPAGTPQGAPRTYQYFNITEARIMGGEVESELNFLRHYQARISMAGTIGDITNADAILRLYGIVQEQAPLASIPPFKGTASLRWRDATGRFWVEPSARWSWRTNRLPPPSGVSFFTAFKKEWMVGDLMMGARLPRGQKVVAGVRNIANRSYTQALGSLEEPGRSFVGSLTVDF